MRKDMVNQLFRTYYTQKEENNIDPDDGNSWMCVACKLPIFSTPFKEIESSSISNNNLYLVHDECSNPPEDLQHTVWRRSSEPLVLLQNNHETRCSKCNDVCGSVSYGCHKGDDITLDLKCAIMIKIVHRSHDHMLMVIHLWSDASFPCGACGTSHRPGLSWVQPVPLAYMCSACCFWLHPHCASLPNAILLNGPHPHPHPLFLNYKWNLYFRLNDHGFRFMCPCAICGEKIESGGAYTCTVCDFYVHIMCAITDNHHFKSVLIRDARFPDLIHFPIPDECTSVVRHITSNSSSNNVLVHKHPLTLNHHDLDEDEDDYLRRPSCNLCIQVISPPFYTCSECPDLFLHDCCAYLPKDQLKENRIVTLITFDEHATKLSFTSCCGRRTNGFTYYSSRRFMDVMCAKMPKSITHDAHSKTHVLYSTFANTYNASCHCCAERLTNDFYFCGTCQSFNIHAKCARLPRTVHHVYDKHPLELVTAHTLAYALL